MYYLIIFKKAFTTAKSRSWRREHRENTMIVKQKTGHRVITNKVRNRNSNNFYYNLCELRG